MNDILLWYLVGLVLVWYAIVMLSLASRNSGRLSPTERFTSEVFVGLSVVIFMWPFFLIYLLFQVLSGAYRKKVRS